MKTQSAIMEAAASRTIRKKDGWYVQLDLHGNNMDGPYESRDEAFEAAVEAVESGETTGEL